MKNIKEIDKLISETQGKAEEIYLFGMSLLGREFAIETSLKIKGVFDNDPLKWGSLIEGHIVNNPCMIINMNFDNAIIIITSDYDKSISEQLQGMANIKWISLPYVMQKVDIQTMTDNKSFDIKTVIIETTNHCNAKCKFCVNSTMKRMKTVMEDDILECILQRLKNEKFVPDCFRLHLLGEPLIDPQLFERIDRIKQEFPNSEIGYTTNFSLATPEIIEKLIASKQTFIVISLNAINEAEYGKVMGNSSLSLEKTIQNIELLVKRCDEEDRKLDITISFVEDDVSHDNTQFFESYWRKKGIKTRIMKKGEWLNEGIKETTMVVEKNNNKIKHYVCGMLKQELCIMSNGDYALCCFDSEGIPKMNIRDIEIHEAMVSSEYVKARIALQESQLNTTICAKCSFITNRN